MLMVFDTISNNISVISCWSVLLVEETGENHQAYRKSLTNFAHILLYQIHLAMNGVLTQNVSVDRH
jgi:hypothetical protein